MTRFRKSLCILLALIAALSMPVSRAEGTYYGSRPVAGIYMTQTRKHTCTLVATMMMLRNYCSLNGTAYQVFDEPTVSRYCWTKRWGLAQHFTIGQLQVDCCADIRNCGDKKQYLIRQLMIHPEGVVIYDTGAPHAIYLIGYDEECDVFYCADTIASRGGRPIKLEKSIIKGATQQDKINTIDKIWVVTGIAQQAA